MTHIPQRPIIETMPLHAITALYGEEGLRSRLAIEAIKLGQAAAKRKVMDALDLAGQLHAHDQRQREPYINHLIRVALRISCHYDVCDADITCAALLHDSVEDHADDLSPAGREGAFANLGARFGPKVADLVAAVTNPVYVPEVDEQEPFFEHDEQEHYLEHVAASLDRNPWARVIKASDFTDNGVGLIYTTGLKAVRSARKYAPLVPILADLIARPDTPLTAQVKVRILRQLAIAQERFVAIAAATHWCDTSWN
jgi:(p)ppGpp synthase/HD superfamily hydrolase